jgi:uncharacterized protein
MTLKIKEGDRVVSENLVMATTFLKRLKGLMFSKELSPQSALYIYPCSAIHTFFMNYNIDVLYLDINNIIIAIDEDMQPGKIGKARKNSVAVVELKGGRVQETCIKVGQTVEIY